MMGRLMPLPSGIVTFVFTDIEGSTRLLRRLGERYAAVLDRHRDVLRTAWQSHGGVEVETEGDAVLAAFADPAAAVEACAEAQRALLREEWPSDGAVRVRMGVHSGLAYPRGHGYVALAVHQASRVVAAAHGGQVIVSEQTAEIAADNGDISLASLGRFRLRDFDAPVQLFQVSGDGLPSEFQSVRALPAEGHNLVRLPTSFVGREESIHAVRDLLGPARLVSVVGPGGVGKTRLVTELGLQVAPAWRDGVWFVDLSPLQDAALIAATIATAVGCSVADAEPWQAVLDHLRQRHALLIVDNCEHVIESVARHATDLLRECANVGVIATSREPLCVSGEQVWRLAPLSTTGDGTTPAAQLFVARAQAVQPTFGLDATSSPIVTAICNQLDGLPLAIELAAARIGVLSPTEILTGLQNRFRLLRNRDRSAPDRQRTLEALLDWSYQLLTDNERVALRRLGVFAGNFGLETATAALADATLDPHDVPDLVWSLADKSLISIEPTANATRYRLFDSIRAYALRLLNDTTETESTATRLADWYLERLGPWVSESSTVTTLRDVEIDNLRGLIVLAAGADQVRAQSLSISIARLHQVRGAAATSVVIEVQNYLSHLTHAGPERVALLCELARSLVNTGQLAAAERVTDEAASLSDTCGAPSWDSTAVEHARAYTANICGDPASAFRIAKQALAKTSNDQGRVSMLNQLAIAASGLGDMRAAYDAAQECLVLDTKLGREENVAISHRNLAAVEAQRGAFQTAAQHLRAALTAASQNGLNMAVVATSMLITAGLESRRDRWTNAVRLDAKADSVLSELGFVIPKDPDREEMLQKAHQRLGNEQYEAERRIGEQLSLPEAIEFTDAVLLAIASNSH